MSEGTDVIPSWRWLLRAIGCGARATLESVSDRKRLLEEALTLPAEERAALAGALIESLDSAVDEDVEAAWSEEIRRRLERVDSGLAKTVPWSEARRRILAAAGRVSNA